MINGREALRWGLAFGVVLGAHIGGAAALLAWRVPHDDLAVAPPAVMIDLSEVAAAPAQEANETPPGPKQEEAEPPAVDTEILARMLPEPEPPEPVKPPEPDKLAEMIAPPDVPPEVVIETPKPKPSPPKPEAKPKPVEKPVRKPDPKPKAVQTTAPQATPSPPQEAAAANAPPPGTAAQPTLDMMKLWQARLNAHMKRYLQYPNAARRDEKTGVAYVTFTVDRNGTVLTKTLSRSAGDARLDREALAVFDRAQPLPALPAGSPDTQQFNMPVAFHLN